jgi:hypothetical protein
MFASGEVDDLLFSGRCVQINKVVSNRQGKYEKMEI